VNFDQAPDILPADLASNDWHQSTASRHCDFESREHVKVTCISGAVKLGEPETIAPGVGGRNWADGICCGGGMADGGNCAGGIPVIGADDGNCAGGGGIPAIVASSVHFARKLPLFKK
jgi:hypothetical protein